MPYGRNAGDSMKRKKQKQSVCVRSFFICFLVYVFECFLFPFAFKKESKHISHDHLNNARHCSRHQDEDKIVVPKVAHVELKTNILPLLRPQIGYRYLLIYPFWGTSIEGFL